MIIVVDVRFGDTVWYFENLLIMSSKTCCCLKVDDIEAKLDVLIDMYKADRPAGMAAGDDTTLLPVSSSKLLHRRPLSLRPDPGDAAVSGTANSAATSPPPPPPSTVAESVQCSRPSRPMLRNMSDLGPRVTGRSMPPWPTVSVTLTSSVSPTDDCAALPDMERSASLRSSSRRHPSIIRESNDETTDRQNPSSPHDHDDDADVVELLPLPVADDVETRANHVAPQQFVDHVSSSSNTIGRTVSPEDSSHSVIVLQPLLETES